MIFDILAEECTYSSCSRICLSDLLETNRQETQIDLYVTTIAIVHPAHISFIITDLQNLKLRAF